MFDYPGRAQLIGAMRPLIKAARRPLPAAWQRYGLDHDGWRQLNRLAHRLARHEYFEHLEREQIRVVLRDAAVGFRAQRSRNAKDFAAATLDGMAQRPLHRTVYLGVEKLHLPDGTAVGSAAFVDPSRDHRLLEALAQFGRAASSLLCRVQASGGTEDLLLERARYQAETALGLVRQQALFGFPARVDLVQVPYRLDGTWACDEDAAGITRVGWWRANPRPAPMDLMHPNLEEWRGRLAEVSRLYANAGSGLLPRVDTCIAWLDVAASSDRWRIIIPAIFAGVEALLVPETSGRKAEVVTVRSVAVRVALDRPFPHPGEIMTGYRLRSVLVHGTPTTDVIGTEATDLAEGQRRWAFGVLCDYLQLAATIGAGKAADVASYLDRGACNDVCTWLEEHGGENIVAAYKKCRPAT